MTSPIDGMRGTELYNNLKNLGIYVLDVETTGLRDRDKMFSAARVKYDFTTDTFSDGFESIFDIGNEWRRNRQQLTNLDDISRFKYFRDNLRDRHSSKYFGRVQETSGSLNMAAGVLTKEAKRRNPLTDQHNGLYFLDTHKNFYRSLADTVLNNKANPNGSVVLVHNGQFEGKQTFKVYNHSDKDTKDQIKRLERANKGNNNSIFGKHSVLKYNSNDDTVLGTRVSTSHKELIDARKSGDQAKINAALNKYVSTQRDVIDKLADITTGIGTGKFTTIDSMVLHQAFMAFGAMNGDVDLKNIRAGGSVDVMMQAWLGTKETHQALDDARNQGKITSILLQELDKFSRDPNYRSARAVQLNDFINQNNKLDSTFVSNLLGEIQDTDKTQNKNRRLKNKQHLKTHYLHVFGYVDKQIESLQGLPEDITYRIKAAQAIKDKMSSLVNPSDRNIKPVTSVSEFAEKMEDFVRSDDFDDIVNKTKVTEPPRKSSSVLKKAWADHKAPILIGAGLVAGSLVLGESGKKENVSYNTFDELYNGQYYGTGFADWQNANNAHKVLY